jgi:hypothetical protein
MAGQLWRRARRLAVFACTFEEQPVKKGEAL